MPEESTKKIILYYPEYDRKVTRSNLLELPLPVLHVAKSLLDEGYEVQILDGRIEGIHDQLRDLESAPLFFGFTCFLGQLDNGLKAAEIFKTRFPQVPVICGGWLPTLYPELFFNKPLFAAIVRGPAEETVKQLARRLARGEDLSGLDGVVPLAGVAPSHLENSFGSFQPPHLDLPYHLLDIDRYEITVGKMDFLASRGCPSLCTFCCMASVYKGGWFSRSAEEIVDALAELNERFGLRRVQFYDDSFFTNPDRATAVAEGLIRKKLDILWMATGGIEDLASLGEDGLKRLARSGLSVVSSGIESGAPRIRRLLGKHFSDDLVITVTERLKKAGIRFAPFFIVGLPEETTQEVESTFTLGARLLETYPDCYPYFSVFLYYPMPGTPLHRMEKACENTHDPLPDMEELRCSPSEAQWGQAPWIPRAPMYAQYRSRRSVKVRAFYFWASYLCPPMVLTHRNPIVEKLRRGLRALLVHRIKKQRFGLPMEWYLYRLGWRLKRCFLHMTASDHWSREDEGLIPQGDIHTRETS